MTLENKASILVVDDTIENIDILVALLEADYDLVVALDGEAALRAVRRALPDMILLDVMMPSIDGYEVCRRLKADPATEQIPVLFLTALTDEANEQLGLELGAVDYIAKPFNPALVKTRVANHLALANARKKLQQYNATLETLVEQRTQSLEDALARLKAVDEAKSEYLFAISHELRTPANGILGMGSLAIDALPPGEESEEIRDCFDESCQRLMSMLDSAMHLAQLQTGKAFLSLEPLSLVEVVDTAISAVQSDNPAANFRITQTGRPPVRVDADRQFLTQSLQTLLKAALKLNLDHSSVEISYEVVGAQAFVRISVVGEALPEALSKTLFDTFSSDRNASYVEDLGLQLPVAEKMIRAMRGQVEVRNADGPGFVITVCLPAL